MTKTKTKIQYDIVDLDSLVGYFVKGYSKDHGEIVSHDWFIDAAKGKAILKLYIQNEATE